MYAHLKRVLRAAVLPVLTLVLASVLASPALALTLTLAGSSYSTYENTAVCFSLEYPSGSTVQQPYDNAVFITGDGYRLAAEYTFTTARQDRFIYSAADFAAMIDADSQTLADWVGNDSTVITGSDRLTIGGQDAWQYDYAIAGEGSGSLYVIDGEGRFGCYCVQTMVDEDAAGATSARKRLAYAAASFTVTGPYEAEGCTLYTHDELQTSFMVRDEAMQGEEELSGGTVFIYPVPHVFVEACIVMGETPYDEDDELGKVLESMCNYYFQYKNNTRYTTQPAVFDLGQYTYAGVELEYYDDEGEHFTVAPYIFLQDGKYWKVELECTDEYLDICRTALSDVLFSLRVGDGSGGALSAGTSGTSAPSAQTGDDSLGTAIYAILDDIESRDDYRSDWIFEPLASVTDMNGDGIYELLAVYECVSSYDGRDYVSCETWLIAPEGAKQVSTGVLYSEIGGNGGSAGLAVRDGTVYVVLETRQPDGGDFDNVYNIFSLANGEARLGDENHYLDCQGTYGAEDSGRYAVDMNTVSRAQFQSFLDSYDTVFDIDLTADNGNGTVMPFNIIRQFY